jgi:hypothetical protein
MVVWEGLTETGTSEISARRVSATGQLVGDPFQVNTYTPSEQKNPWVASDVAGNVVVVWQSQAQAGVFGQRYDFLGARLGDEFRVSDGGSYPAVAQKPDGDFLVAWTTADEDGLGIYARRFLASGAPATAAFRVNTFTTANQSFAGAGASANGFVVAWSSYGRPDDDLTGLYAQRYLATGAPAGGEFHVNTYTTGPADGPRIAVKSNGDFVMVWRGYADGDEASVEARRYAASGAPLGDEFRVNTVTVGPQAPASVAFDSASTFIVVWANQGSAHDVKGQRYLATGAEIGTEFRVNSMTTGDQLAPQVSSVPGGLGGRYLVAFRSPDGSADGISVRAGCLIGDANVDGVLNVSDVFYIINTAFASGPPSLGCADVNESGTVDIVDIFYLINYLFASGPPPF